MSPTATANVIYYDIYNRSLNREPSRRSVYLSKFLRRRPTKEDLKAQGVLKVRILWAYKILGNFPKRLLRVTN